MKVQELLQSRLLNTGVSTSPFSSPEPVVAHLGAVQSQDFSTAKWAVDLRMQNATNEIVENIVKRRQILANTRYAPHLALCLARLSTRFIIIQQQDYPE